MTTTILTLIAFVLLIVSWRCWKKTARACVRDQLFELRDEWRMHYVENGLDMEDCAYAQIRSLLNGMLRYTKSMRMTGFIYFSSQVAEEDVANSASKLDALIGRCNPETKELVKRIRRQASESILLYMASTSLGFISAAIVMFVYLLPDKIFEAIKTCVRSVVDVKPATLELAVMR